jgi:YidC/Oxa1 family membrane protein insertase
MLLVIVLGMAIFIGWNHFFGPKSTPRDDTARRRTPQEAKAPAEETRKAEPTLLEGYTVSSDKPANVAEYRGPSLGSDDYLGEYAMKLDLTARGAGVERIVLGDYFASVNDRDLPAAERRKLELIRRGVGRAGFVLTRLNVALTGAEEAVPLDLDLPPSRLLAELNGGRGVSPGRIIISDGANDVIVDLTKALTVGDVLKAINGNGVVEVKAAVHSATGGLWLTGPKDNESRLSVREDGDGRTASDLGILQHSALDEGEPLVGESLNADPWWHYDAEWTQAHPEEARFTLDVADRNGDKLLTIIKTIILKPRGLSGGEGGQYEWDGRFDVPEAFAPRMTLSIIDHTKEKSVASVSFTMRGPEGLVCEDTRSDIRRAVAGRASQKNSTEFKTAAEAEKPSERSFTERPAWVGMVDKYFAAALVAESKSPEPVFATAEVYRAHYENEQWVPGVAFTSLLRPCDDEKGGTSASYLLFAGPLDSDLLNQEPLAQYGLLNLVKWSSPCCPCFSIGFMDTLIGGISKYMVLTIDWLSEFVINKGLAVILLVILVRLLMFPISRFGQIAMLKMQDLQPELTKLKEQYKDDKQKFGLEQMKLMRERGANPMLGCLPMMLQLPIWIALYTGLSVAISLRQAPFVAWISDLARPDGLFPIPETDAFLLSAIGGWAQWQFNLLPLLTVVAFYLQMKFQPQASGGSPEMERQQKMMKWMMPGMMLLFFYTAPSALNLYIMTSSALGFVEQKLVRKQYERRKLLAPKVRPEKPKGRFALWLDSHLDRVRKFQEQAQKSENRFESKKKKK